VQALTFENGHLEEKPAKVQEFFSKLLKNGGFGKNTCIFAGIWQFGSSKSGKRCKITGFDAGGLVPYFFQYPDMGFA